MIWYKFKNDYIFNESKIEGSKLKDNVVAEIVTDLRLKKQESEYCTSDFIDVVETAGQADLYDYIFQNDEKPKLFSILELHKILYKYAPYPEAGGRTRNTNNLVTNSKFETYDYNKIVNGLLELDGKVKALLDKGDDISISDFIEEALIIHHGLTVIHPFFDGNGRISRMFLNWLFKTRNLPPVYLKYKSKEKYYSALREADISGNYNPLKVVFYNEIIHTMISIYGERSL